MRAVWKFPLTHLFDVQIIEAPKGWQPLCVQYQGDQVCLWAEVETEAKRRRYPIRIHGTGHPVSGAFQYIGTFQMQGGALVFHVYAGAPIP